ncbi:MAG: hypothetical protein JST90_12270 [Bacteroidetes bacterium]|nr:hypothetical protein [Bacteroidota bacterium]
MKIAKALIVIVPILIAALLMNSCHKEQFAKSGALSFSTDTLTFDTVFTTLGSTTRYFKVRNTQSKSLLVSDIKLLQLQGNQFRINVDGVAGTEFTNVDIPAHDSIYVFVEVTVNPNNQNNPFVILDQIQFTTNGNTQNVVLEAMGQNAHYYFSDSATMTSPVTFYNDKPNIIVNRNGGLPIFAVKPGATLTIQPKAQIFMGPNAVITVDGTLNAHGGDWSDSIVFQYIRRDYQNAPGQWLGITYSRGATINMDHVIVDQSTFGVSDEYVLDLLASAQITTSDLRNYSSSATPTVTLDKCIIRNCSSNALTAIQTNLTATNCLIHSSGGQMVVLGMGGTYTMNNCTMVDASQFNPYINHQNPSLTLTDRLSYLNTNTPVGPYTTTVSISNSTVVGSQDNEIAFTPAPSMLAAHFSYCNLSMNQDTFSLLQPLPDSCVFNSNLNQLFYNPQYGDFRPDSLTSPLYNKGNPATQRPDDLYDYTRGTRHSVGAIEWQGN